MVGKDLHRRLAAVRVDDHVDLPFVHGDGDAAHGRGRDAQLFEGALDALAGVACGGEIFPVYVIFETDAAHDQPPNPFV